MKILIRTVFLTIVVLINFFELNSSAGFSGKSSATYYESHRKISIDYMERKFTVTLNYDHVTPARCYLVVPRGKRQLLPDTDYRKHHNYVTRAVISPHGKGFVTCVVYIEEDGTVLGAKLPPTEATCYKLPAGHPGRLNPDANKWFITYGGLDYKVHVDPVSGDEIGIELMPANVIPSQGYRARNRVVTIPVFFAGLYFVVHKRMDYNVIVGAELLDPYWQEREQVRLRSVQT